MVSESQSSSLLSPLDGERAVRLLTAVADELLDPGYDPRGRGYIGSAREDGAALRALASQLPSLLAASADRERTVAFLASALGLPMDSSAEVVMMELVEFRRAFDALRIVLLNEIGTTDPELLCETLQDMRAARSGAPQTEEG